MRFRGTTCDQCKAEAKHPGHGLSDGPIQGWLRIVNDCDSRFDFCSFKCAIDWLKERKRQKEARADIRVPVVRSGAITGSGGGREIKTRSAKPKGKP